MRTDADLIVAGGGPAGSVSAWLAAREGLKVILVDPGRHRPRLEGLSPRLRHWLAGQGLLDGFRHIHGPLRRQVSWAGISESNAEYVVERAALDAHLRQMAQRAGARIVTGSARPEPGRVILSEGDLAAPLVIDARGRKAGQGAHRAPATVALSGWMRTAVSIPPGIRLVAFAGGWMWRVVLPDGRIWVQVMQDAAGKGTPAERLATALAEADPGMAGTARPEGCVIAREAAPRLPRPVDDLRLLSVGDSFAAMDPLSGHGQFWAVSSALAVAAVRRTLAARPGSQDMCRRFLNRRAGETSLHQARIGRDFLRAETRFARYPFWAARIGFPDDLPASPRDEGPRIAQDIVVENGLLAERTVLVTPKAPNGIAWLGDIPAAEAWQVWRQGGEDGLEARWGPAARGIARQLAGLGQPPR